MHVGILGGTGPAGQGLAARLGVAGTEVTLGSRDAERAKRVAGELVDLWPERGLKVRGGDNAEAAGADLVVVGTPWDSATATISSLKDELSGKIVVSMVVALAKVGRQMQAITVARGSMAAEIQAALPDSMVAASMHHLPAADMADLDVGLSADVLVCSDNPQAGQGTVALIDSIEGLRALDAGGLGLAGAIEAFTAVLINVNIRYKAHTTLRLGGI